METERLVLRPWRASDLPAAAALLSDPEVMAFSDRGPLGPEEARAWLGSAIASTSDGGALGCRAVELRRTGAAIGYVSLLDASARTRAGDAEIGLRLAKAHWRRGYASEAAAEIVATAFGTASMPRIVGIVDPQNLRSVRMLRRLGFTFERSVMFDGYDHADHLYVKPREPGPTGN